MEYCKLYESVTDCEAVVAGFMIRRAVDTQQSVMRWYYLDFKICSAAVSVHSFTQNFPSGIKLLPNMFISK